MSLLEVPNPLDAVARRIRRLDFPYRSPTIPGGVEPLDEPARWGGNYDTAWARRFPARLTRALLLDLVAVPGIKALARPRVAGKDRIETLRADEEPVIFVANHHSHVDTPLILSSLPEPWRYRTFVGAAADYFFTNRLTSAASALVINAIPIERTRVNRRSADLARQLIADGWSMLIYPEGGRSPDGWGQPFRGGAGYIALRAGVPVVPIHVAGTDRILPKGKGRPTPGQSRVTFGAPIRPDDSEDARALAVRIEAAVAALDDESRTDWWSARKRAHRGESPALGGPDAPNWRRQWALGDRSGKRRRQRRRWP